MDNNSCADVSSFVSDFLNVKEESLSCFTKLRKDLGLDGDDAYEFMAAFSSKFDVNLASFQFDRYFGDEAGFNPILFLIRKIFKQSDEKEEITLGRLQESIKEKKW